MTPTASPREEIVSRLWDFAIEHNMTSPYGGTGLSDDHRYRYMLFCRPRTLDGTVEVYGPRFIRVTYHNGPYKGNHVFGSVDDALRFLRCAFVDNDWASAMAVTGREP